MQCHCIMVNFQLLLQGEEATEKGTQETATKHRGYDTASILNPAPPKTTTLNVTSEW